MINNLEKPISFNEAAEYLKISKPTLRKMLADKQLRFGRLRHKYWFYPSQLEEDIKGSVSASAIQ